jgi:prevent-host-death family protein
MAMKHVPIATFKDKLSQYIAEAEAGDEIMVTRHGKPTVRLVPAEADRRKSQRDAIEALWALGQKIKKERGPTPIDAITGWVREDRR